MRPNAQDYHDGFWVGVAVFAVLLYAAAAIVVMS